MNFERFFCRPKMILRVPKMIWYKMETQIYQNVLILNEREFGYLSIDITFIAIGPDDESGPRHVHVNYI